MPLVGKKNACIAEIFAWPTGRSWIHRLLALDMHNHVTSFSFMYQISWWWRWTDIILTDMLAASMVYGESS